MILTDAKISLLVSMVWLTVKCRELLAFGLLGPGGGLVMCDRVILGDMWQKRLLLRLLVGG